MNKLLYIIIIFYFNFSIVFSSNESKLENNINEIKIDNAFFFEDIFLLRQCHKYQKFGISNMVDMVVFDILDNVIGDFTTEEKIDNFNKYIGFSLYDIPNYQTDKNNIYKEIININEKFYYEDDYEKKMFNIFNNFADKIGKNILMEAYNKYESTDIYSTDKYMINYYKLLNFFSELSDKEITNNMIENWIIEMMKDCSDIEKNILNNDILVIALLFREMKTFNKLLFGRKLSKLDIFFNDIFCESDITILYNLDALINSISSIIESKSIYENNSNIKDNTRNQIYDIFNRNQTISENISISHLQSTIKYYTNNNNSNKFVGIYDTFNAVTSYIYYNYNIYETETNNKRNKDEEKEKDKDEIEVEVEVEGKYDANNNSNLMDKKYKFKEVKDNYAKEAFEYLMEFVDKDKKESYNDLESINLSELDDIIKQNIFTIYEQVTSDDKTLKNFFSGLFQILEYFSVKNSLNYRKYISRNHPKEFIEFKNNPEEITKAIEELKKLKILVETVNSIIYQINIKEGIKTIYNPKKPSSMIYLKSYMIIKQDETIENINNFIDDISELKRIYKSIDKLSDDEFSTELYYKDSSVMTIDNESIGGTEGSLMENFNHLLEAVLQKIKEEEFYSKRCMSTLNQKNSTITENENYRNFIFSKYQILPKVYYDIKNYYFDLGIDCREQKNEMKSWIERFSQFCFPYLFCFDTNNYGITDIENESKKSKRTTDSKDSKDKDKDKDKDKEEKSKFLIFYNTKNNTLENLTYDDIRIKINSIDSFETEERKDLHLSLNDIKAYLEEKYKQKRFKSLYDLKMIYDEILYYDKFLFENLPYNEVESFKILMDTSDLDILNNIFNAKSKYKDILMEINHDDTKNNSAEDDEDNKKEKFMDTMDVIINDNGDILFDNFIDKNVYQFTCDTNYYTEAKNKYELRKKEYLNNNYIIKNIFVRYLIENTILYQNAITLFNENDISSKINEEVFNSDIYSYASKRFIDTKDIPYYFFNYGIDEYVEYINKHHYNTIMDIVSKNETLKTLFINTFENDNLSNTNKFSPDVTNNNLTKLIMIQDILVKYINDSPIITSSSLEKREDNQKEEENGEDNKNNKKEEVKKEEEKGEDKKNNKKEEVKKEEDDGESVESLRDQLKSKDFNFDRILDKEDKTSNILYRMCCRFDYISERMDETSAGKKPDIDSNFWNKLDEYYSNEMKTFLTIIKFVEAVSDYRHDRKIAKKIFKKQQNAAKKVEDNKEHNQEKIDKNKDKTYSSKNTVKKNTNANSKKNSGWFK